MDWTNENVMRFLELYQMHPCIWDPRNPSHKNKTKLTDAWTDIKDHFGEPCTVAELKKKKESLMSAYRGYRTKIKKSETLEDSDVYKPIWFAYSFMDSFLGTIYKCTASVSSEDYEYNIVDSNNSQDDTGDTTTTGESDPLRQEQKCFSHALLQHGPKNLESFTQQTSTATTPKRKQHNSPEMQQTKQLDQALNNINTASQQKFNEEEDECCIFGKLIAKKMRKLPEDRRDLMMYKISELFYNESNERHRSNSTSSTLSSPYTTSSLSRVKQEDSSPQVINSFTDIEWKDI